MTDTQETPQYPEDVEISEEEQARNLIDDANRAADRLARENEKRAKLLDKEEALKAKEIVSGESDAGQKPQKKKEMTEEEMADACMQGDLNLFGGE